MLLHLFSLLYHRITSCSVSSSRVADEQKEQEKCQSKSERGKKPQRRVSYYSCYCFFHLQWALEEKQPEVRTEYCYQCGT